MKNLGHPLDQVFDIERFDAPDSTPPLVIEEDNIITPPKVALDDDDKEIDRKIDTVYDSALTQFGTMTAMIEFIEPKFAARNGEVAAQFLNIALNAATARASVKASRRKSASSVNIITQNNDNSTTNVSISASREEILMMAKEAAKRQMENSATDIKIISMDMKDDI